MGEALDMAKKKLGLGNNPPESTNKKGDALEEAINKIDSLDAREALRARVREITANAELRAREAENRLRQLGGTNMEDHEKRREAEKELREEISSTAVLLLEKGVDPKIVGQYIMGSTPVTPITLSGNMPPVQGLTIKDVKEIMELATGNKGESELKGVLEKLTAKVEAIGSHQPLDPITFAKQQAEQTRAYYETLKSLGMIKEPEIRTEGGESLEVVKEKHRHEEKMGELSADREYKQELTKIASGIPERIGRGIAGQFGESEEGESSSGGLEYVECEDCHTKIYITPETGSQVTCPKCEAIYQRKGTVETKEE